MMLTGSLVRQKYSRRIKAPRFHWESLWACCNCGRHAGMSVDSTSACPECGIYRCDHCPLENIKRNFNEPWQYPGYNSQARTGQFSKTTVLVVPSLSPSLSQKPVLCIVPAISTNSPESSTSSPTSKIFTPKSHSPESSTDVDLDDIESQGSDHEEEDISYEEHALSVLEARVRALLDDNLPFLATLVPEVYHAVRRSLRLKSDAGIKSHPSLGDAQEATYGTSGSGSGSGSSSSSTFPTPESNKRAAPFKSEPRKRLRGLENEESNESPGIGWKKAKPLSGENPLKFACHYHKLDPLAYNIHVHRKYKICPAPSVPVGELVRIKGHFEAAHGPLYCERCFTIFQRGQALIDHCSSLRCLSVPLSHIEGISSERWQMIHGHAKANRGLIGTERERHEYERWFDIWEDLFPGTPKPAHPFTEDLVHEAPRFHEVRSFMNALERIIRRDIERGVLREDDDIHRHYLNAAEMAFHSRIQDYYGGDGSNDPGSPSREHAGPTSNVSPEIWDINEQLIGILPDIVPANLAAPIDSRAVLHDVRYIEPQNNYHSESSHIQPESLESVPSMPFLNLPDIPAGGFPHSDPSSASSPQPGEIEQPFADFYDENAASTGDDTREAFFQEISYWNHSSFPELE